MKKKLLYPFYYFWYLGRSKVRLYKMVKKKQIKITTPDEMPRMGKRKVMDAHEFSKFMVDQIESGRPFMLGRIGATEMSCVSTFDFRVKSKYGQVLEQMKMWSGFFENTKEAALQYMELTKDALKTADALIYWEIPYYEYYIKKYSSQETVIGDYYGFTPWLNASDTPWTSAFEGKKVVVVHPFSDLIEKQYQKRELLFPGTNILPEFELRTVKAVQTVAGARDERFESWFDALEWMYQEVIREDFDIAIIGCGAYGFPLAAKIKKYGKQAIHMAGHTQLLFGIKGSRWKESPEHYEWWNDAWVWPGENEKVEGIEKVENGCYW